MSRNRKAIGVLREAPFAPILFKEDSQILLETTKRLLDLGLETEISTIEKIQEGIPIPVVVLNMCEGSGSLEKLRALEAQGSIVINRPEAVKNCYRIRMISMLSEHALPFPKSLLVNLESRKTGSDLTQGTAVERPVWLKRGDVHSTQAGDVRLVHNPWELERGLRDFIQRGISHAVLQEHLEGDLVKFYAVKNRSFFKCYLQAPEGTKKPYPRDSSILEKISSLAAGLLGLEVYGGDFVISAKGPVLIDINAWPSFAPCFEEAAAEIASRVIQVLSARVKTT